MGEYPDVTDATERSHKALRKMLNQPEPEATPEAAPTGHDELCQNPAGHTVPGECTDADGKPLEG